MTGPAIACCSCGSPVGATVVRYTLDQHELTCHATGAGRVLLVDAAIACSVTCLVAYLTTELESS